MKIARNKAIELFEFLGLKNSDQLSNMRLGKRMKTTVPSMIDDDDDIKEADDATSGLLSDVLEAISSDEKFVIVDSLKEESEEPKKKRGRPKKTEAVEKPKRGRPKKKEVEDKPVKTAKVVKKKKVPTKKTPTTKKKKVQTKKVEANGEEKKKPVGVRGGRSRMFCAGQVLGKYGLEIGVTDEMAREVDKLFEDENLKQSKTTLVNAWHVVRGYKKTESK